MLSKIWAFLGGNKMGFIISTVIIILATVKVMEMTVVATKEKKILESESRVSELKDSLVFVRNIETLQKRQIGELQLTIKAVDDKAKKALWVRDLEIKKLEEDFQVVSSDNKLFRANGDRYCYQLMRIPQGFLKKALWMYVERRCPPKDSLYIGQEFGFKTGDPPFY